MPINIVINKKDREYRNSIFDEATLLYFYKHLKARYKFLYCEFFISLCCLKGFICFIRYVAQRPKHFKIPIHILTIGFPHILCESFV
nr:MAG TPA: hypothetical protein [Caudoviricetes sp.]